MSIATTAPEKFDFQDLVCAELALRFEERAGASLIIEPAGGEDAELGFDPPAGGVSLIEVQVKGTASAVTLASIAECLTHFPPRKATSCLLERLIDNPFRVVLLVMSGRCDDAASRYVMGPDWDGATHPPSHLRIADAKALLQAFKIADLPGKDSSKLKANRKVHIEKLAQTLDPAGLRTVFERLIVVERVSSSYLEAQCEHHLRARHRIPGDRCPDVIARLQTSIKRAKSEGVDAFPLIQTILKEVAPPPLRPVGYVDRGQEKKWTEVLSQEKALLLSGSPRCGKSDAARRIAAEFQSLGYEVRVGSDADEATRFLLDNSIGDCLYVLDDPLGGTRPVPEPERTLERLRTLVPQLTNNRKLLVAQTQDRLSNALPVRLALEHFFRVVVSAVIHQRLGELGAFLSRAQIAHSQVVRDTQEPGDKGRPSRLVSTDRLPSLEKRLSGQGFGFGRVPHHVVDMAIDANDVSIIQRAERLAVTLDRALNQGTFVQLVRRD